MIISIPLNPTLIKQKAQPYIAKAIWLPQFLAGLGIIIGYGSWLLPFTPFLLSFFSLVILIFSTGIQRKKLVYFFLFAFLGFLVEVLGVQTGIIFGQYSYGSNLGLKLAGVPIVIGLNWAMLIFSINIFINQIKIPNIARAILAALALIFLDFIMEQSAGVLDFWHFKNGQVPWINYSSWFLISLLMSYIFQFNFSKIKSTLASHLYLSQVAFFILAYLGH